MTHVLCPIDLSDASSHVVVHASAVARWYDARLTLLHVVIGRPAMGIPAPPLDQTEVDRLVVAMRAVAVAVPASVDTDFVVRHAAAADVAILDEALARQADVLVLGTHGRTGLKRLLLGSVAEAVLRQNASPTLVVPPRAADIPADAPVRFHEILCAVDFSDCSLGAAHQAIALARRADAHLTLLHVIQTPPELNQDTTADDFNVDHIRAAAEAEALRRLRSLKPHGVALLETISTAVEEGEPSRAVLNTAARINADLIVMGVHSRRAVDLLIFGSTTDHVLREALCPVLIIRKD